MKNIVNKRYYEVNQKTENIEVASICLAIIFAALALPLAFSNSSIFATQNNQFLIGPIVNCALIYAAINCTGWSKLLSVAFLPSICTIITGALFAMSSAYALYMIPAIWLGNFTLVFLYKYLFAYKKLNFALSSVIAIVAKVLVIASFFGILVAAGAIPASSTAAKVMWPAMSVYQLITATIGAMLAYGIIKILYKPRTN